ncbi:MAG: TonB-dependent receptor [Pseudomonadota bacterium]
MLSRTKIYTASLAITLGVVFMFGNETHAQTPTRPAVAQDVRLDSMPLADALIELSLSFGVSILADERVVSDLTIRKTNGTFTVQQALEQVLVGTGLVATPAPSGGYVVTKLSQRWVRGTIVDAANNRPLTGVRIGILNRRNTVLSDNEGRFTLGELPSGTYTLYITATGYAAQRIPIDTTRRRPLVIALESARVTLPDEIVVSANRQEESSLEVPVSISKVDAEDIVDLQLVNSRDLTALSGNLAAADFGGGDGINFSIRGITSLNFDPSVAVYVDGINQFDIYSSIESFDNAESIEILKGPQGTIFGRNALGGVINIKTRQTPSEWEGRINLAAGNFSTRRIGGFVGGPLVENQLFLSASALYSDQDGFYTNSFDGSNFNAEENIGGSLSATYTPDDYWSFNLAGKRYIRNVDGYVPYAITIDEARANPFTTAQDATGRVSVDLTQFGFTSRYSGAHFNLSNVLAYQTSEYEIANVDIDFTTADLNTFSRPIPGEDNISSVLTNELQFSSPASASGLRWLAGLYAFSQDLPINQSIRNGTAAALFDPTAPNEVLNLSIAENRGYAVFGQLVFPLSERLELTVGARYDKETRQTVSSQQFVPLGGPAITISPEQTREVDFDAFSPRLALNWFFNESLNLYFTYSLGNRIGGVNNATNPAFSQFDPETSDTYELGAKGSALNGRLTYALAAFYAARDNIQTQVFEPGIAGFSFITLSNGEGVNQGIEFETQFLLTDSLKMRLSMGLLDATYDRLDLPNFLTGENRELRDRDAIIAPDVTADLSLDYSNSVQLGDLSLPIDSILQWTYIGDQAFDFENTNKQSGYSLINLRAGTTFRNWGIYLWSENLLDEEYIQWSAPIGSAIAYQGPPRTYGLSLEYSF